jgi:hypothetical protein
MGTPVIKNFVEIKQPTKTFASNKNNNDFFEDNALLKAIKAAKRKTNCIISKSGA